MKSKKVLGILISMVMVMTTMIIPTTAFGAEGGEGVNETTISQETTEGTTEGSNPSETTEPTDVTDPTESTDPIEPTETQKQGQEITISDDVESPIVIEYNSGFDLEGLNAEAKTDLNYKSSDESIFTVNEDNLSIEAVDIGEATLTITAEETEEYNEATKEVGVMVIEAEQTISVDDDIDLELAYNDDVLALEPGESRALNAEAMGVGGTLDYEVNPSDGNITIDENGVVEAADTALIGDEAIITINSSNFYGYNDCSFSFAVKVVEYDGYSTDEFFEGPEGYSFSEKHSTLYRTKETEDDEWSEVKFKLDPDYDISANAAAGLLNIWNGWKFVKAERNIVFGDDIENALSESNTLEISIGETASLKALPQETEFYSDDNEIVEVDENGVVTPVYPGETTIDAYVSSNEWFKESDREINVKVNKGTQIITVDESIEKPFGAEQFNICAALTTGDGQLTYESSDSNVASVDEDGNVAIGKIGTATITVSASETDLYKPATKKVEITVVKGQQAITAESSINKSIGEKSFNIGASSDGDGKLTYSLTTSGKKIISVNSSGKVTIKKIGSATVTINAAETDNYKAASPVKVKITVGKLGKAKLTAKAIGGKKVKLTWNEVPGARSKNGYQISQNGNKIMLTGNVGENNTRYITNSKLKKGKTYKYKIRAVTKVNGKTYYGAWSAVKKVKVK